MSDKKENAPQGASPRKVLLITYGYPPSNTPGVFRIMGFVNYFREFGFDPVVLTAKNPTDHSYDGELCGFVRGEPLVSRAWGIDLKKMAVALKRLVTRPARPHTGPDTGGPEREKQGASPTVEKQGPGAGGLKRFVARLLEFPDTRIGWVPFGLLKAHRLMSKHGISYVLTSSPPHSIQLIGLLLKLLHPKCVWVSDYRDPWTDNLVIRSELPPALDRLERRLERAAHRRSDIIVANTTTNRDILLRNNPSVSSSKVVVVPNGTDPEDFVDLAPIREEAGSAGAVLQSVFVGSLYEGMIDSFLQSLLVLKERMAPSLGRMHFQFIGYADDADREKVESYGLADVVSFKGVVSYKKSLQYMLGADLLLYLLPPGEAMGHWIPSKLYNYLHAGRPILAMIPEGDAAAIIRRFDAGAIFDPCRKEDVAEFLDRFVDDRTLCGTGVKADAELLRPFERRSLVKKLAGIMSAATHGSSLKGASASDAATGRLS